MRRRVLALAIVVVVALMAVVGGWWFGGRVVAGAPRATGVATAVVGANGVSLDVAGVHVEGPAGVAPPGTVLSAVVTGARPGGVAAEFASGVGDGIALSLGGVQPAVPLTVVMPVSGEPAAGAAGVLVTRPSGASETQLVAGVYSAATRTVTAQVSHLSDFWAGFFRFDRVTEEVSAFLSQTAGLTTARPRCAGQPVKDSGGTVSLGGDYSAKANPVVWPCVRVEKGAAVVTLTANTPLPWRVRATPDARLDPPGTLDASKALILSGYNTLVTERPYAEGLLVPGGSITYRFPLTSLPGTIQGQADVGTYLAMSLLFGLDLAMNMFGIDTGDIGKSADALSCLGDAVEAADVGTKPAAGELADLARAVLGCVGGVAGAPAKVVLSILGGGIALVVGGLQGAIITATGKDRFSIPVNRAEPAGGRATKVVNVVAATSTGQPAAGYTTEAPGSTVDACTESVSTVAVDIVSCSPSAASANICWVAPDRVTLLCGTQPWKKTLLSYTASEAVPTTPPPANPQPWALELADGSRCLIRNGGAWPGRADDYAGAYSCEGPTEFVLSNTGDYVNHTTATWTVRVGPLSAENDITTPPATMRVTTAWFAAR